MEESLFNMFKYFSMNPDNLLSSLIQSYEKAFLEEIKRVIDERIRQLSGAAPSADTEGLNPFSILGVGFDVTEEELTRAYRKAAWSAHPDHGGSNEKMAKVNAAYEVIQKFKGWWK